MLKTRFETTKGALGLLDVIPYQLYNKTEKRVQGSYKIRRDMFF